MKTIDYNQFYFNLYGLKGDYGEILRLRNGLLNGGKLDSEETKTAFKVLSKKQDKLLNKRSKQSVIDLQDSRNNYIKNILS